MYLDIFRLDIFDHPRGLRLRTGFCDLNHQEHVQNENLKYEDVHKEPDFRNRKLILCAPESGY